jgi:microcystin-dependent protein
MTAPYVGEIRMFAGNFAPAGWLFCDGTQLQISNFETLFQLIGTTYGGDGVQTFNLPDLRGRTPIHMGTGPGGVAFVLSQSGGAEQVTLTTQTIPSHNHNVTATGSGQATIPKANMYPASVTPTNNNVYGPPDGSPATFAASTIGTTGGSQPHNNIQPYQAINFIISLFGIFPSRN